MLTPPCSHSLKMEAVTMRHLALTRKMIADRLVIWRVKLKIRPANKRRQDERQGDLAEGVLRIRPQDIGGFFDGWIDLLQGGDTGADRGGQAAHDEGSHDDISAADHGKRHAGKGERAGHGQPKHPQTDAEAFALHVLQKDHPGKDQDDRQQGRGGLDEHLDDNRKTGRWHCSRSRVPGSG